MQCTGQLASVQTVHVSNCPEAMHFTAGGTAGGTASPKPLHKPAGRHASLIPSWPAAALPQPHSKLASTWPGIHTVHPVRLQLAAASLFYSTTNTQALVPGAPAACAPGQ